MENSSAIEHFYAAYVPIHKPLVYGLCIFGIVTNVVNIVVLTRKTMLASPTNIILLGLSFAQLFLLINFFGYTVYTSEIDSDCGLKSKSLGWLIYLAMNVNLNLVLHSIALVLTSLLAIYRYLAIHFPTRRIVTIQRVKTSVIGAFVAVPVVCVTFYANTKFIHQPQHIHKQCNVSMEDLNGVYQIGFQNPYLTDANFWIFAIFAKIVPCVCLWVLSFALMRDMKLAEKRRKRMFKSDGNRKKSMAGVERQRTKTTMMLLVIVILFVSVELPQGILNILSATLKGDFRTDVYSKLSDLFEMLTVFYSSVNFILYCLMSSQFRKCFKELFVRPAMGEGLMDPLQKRLSEFGAHLKKRSQGTNGNSTEETVMSEATVTLLNRNNQRRSVTDNPAPPWIPRKTAQTSTSAEFKRCTDESLVSQL